MTNDHDSGNPEVDEAAAIAESLLPRRTWTRWLLWGAVALAPLVLGLLQLHDVPILPQDPDKIVREAAENLSEDETLTQRRLDMARSRENRQSAQGLMYLSSWIACLLLGLLGVRDEKLWAIPEGLIMTFAAFLFVDSPGAPCLGFIAFPIFGWCLIVLGAAIRSAVLWPCKVTNK